MPPHSAEDRAPVQNGDLVLLDYELWAEGGGRADLVDTTRQEVAEAAKVERGDGSAFGPRPHLIGGDFFPAGLEAALVGAVPGEEAEKTIPPAEAFGEKDPKLIELFSMHEIARLPEMRREDAQLEIGTPLTIRGRRGRVVSLTAARVRVDFNPAFSGRPVRAKFTVLSRIVEPAEKVRAFIELYYGHGKDFRIEVAERTITIHTPDRVKFDLAWVASKPRLIERLRSQLNPALIRIVEEHVTPVTEKKKEAAAPAADAEPSPAAPAAETKGKHASASHAHAHPKAADDASKA